MKRLGLALVTVACMALTASGYYQDEDVFHCTLTGKAIKTCCCEKGKNGNLHCTLANKDVKKCCCEGVKPSK